MTRARDIASGIDFITGIDAGEVVPHIIPGKLYPAVAGKLLDGSTSHSGAYGTAQSDGRSYYYTDIKGSKSIKDPRIGGHFGSQRHKCKSMQLLEQETATNGTKVFSIDGREWCRMTNGWKAQNNDNGQYIQTSDNPASIIEIVGYFTDINLIIGQNSDERSIKTRVDGGTISSANTLWDTVSNPLGGDRYVDSGNVGNLGLGLTLGIHTFRFEPAAAGENIYWFGFEMIAQDTTSTATKSQIQIPSQNVVSYGKKFTVSGTPHYDPFNGMTNLTTLHSAKVDTATSLGLDTGTTYGASWSKSSTEHIRPFNSGRVVKWVASDGTIKTSVTMMPRNAQTSMGTVSNEISQATLNGATTTNAHIINFSDDAVDFSLMELTKTYNWIEFGNGSANQGHGGNRQDWSMTDNADSQNITYVMDDGLTSFAGLLCRAATDYQKAQANETGGELYFTFIGSGCSFDYGDNLGHRGICINLPYGTHVVRIHRNSGAPPDLTIDGITFSDLADSAAGFFSYGLFQNMHIYQPKKPPIPKEACIIADFMLMADVVHLADNGGTATHIQHNKGVRRIAASRDIFYNGSATINYGQHTSYNSAHGHRVFHASSDTSKLAKLPYFGTGATFYGQLDGGYTTNALFKINGTAITASSSGTNHSGSQTLYSQTTGSTSFSGDNDGTFTMAGSGEGYAGVTGINLGTNVVEVSDSSTSYFVINHFEVQIPIHTSSHYQTFETPFLKELVGGDRNMELTNLVVTSDGKTWDEVTRDTSYLGNICINTNTSTSFTSSSSNVIFDDWRGTITSKNTQAMNKDFAIGYDRMICLVPGDYKLSSSSEVSGSGVTQQIKVNGTPVGNMARYTDVPCQIEAIVHLKRGDYVQYIGAFFGGQQFNYFHIVRI